MKKISTYFNIQKALLFFWMACFFSSVHAQVPVTSGGLGQTSQTPINAANGGAASGLGCGGGGANFYGGNGGDGKFGGGGGGAAGFTAPSMIGGAGGQGVLVVSFYNGASFLYTNVYQNGTSLSIPSSVTQIKAWVIGAGGGGAGSTANDLTSGGGGGAGGVAYITKTMAPGNVITYSLGTAGTGGINTNNGNNGGNTSATINAITVTGFGGSGGQYNNDIDAIGGLFSGGDGGGNGGNGKGISGDKGGSGGGGIGGALGAAPTGGAGANGANAADVSGLFSALSSGVLPLTWKRFTVNNQDGGVSLQWETSFEVNTINFTIQYSIDGTQFKNIGVVPAANNANGNKYYFIHKAALPGISYYRLYQTDINNQYSYSKVVKNNLPSVKDKDFILFNNAISDGNIKMQVNKNITINLLSFDGKIITVKNAKNGVNYINVSNLAKGYYILKSLNESQKIMIK